MAQIRWMLGVLGLLLMGCRPASKAPSPPAVISPSTISTSIKGLQALIVVPRRPVSATWQYTQVGDGNMGPSDSRLMAVILYKPADADALEKSARKSSAFQKGEVEVSSWFPSPLRQKATRRADGQFVLRGDKLDASAFYHLSLQNGFLMRVPNTSYIVVSLFTT